MIRKLTLLTLFFAAGALLRLHAAELEKPPEDMKPLMNTRGKLLFSDEFNRAEVGSEWAVAKGKWEIREGVLKGAELKEDNHAAVLKHKMDCHDFVAQFSFQFQGGKAVSFSLNQKGHVCRVAITPAGFTVRKDKPSKKSTEKGAVLGTCDMKFNDGQWYTMLVEIRGKEMLAMIDDSHVVAGEHAGIDVDKGELALPVGGDGVLIDNLKIWEAQPNPDWEQARKKLTGASR